MSASERKVVHDHLRSAPGIETFSEGEEPDRCVIVAPLVARVTDAEQRPARPRRPSRASMALREFIELHRRPTRARRRTVRDPQEAWRTSRARLAHAGSRCRELRDGRPDRRRRRRRRLPGARPGRGAARGAASTWSSRRSAKCEFIARRSSACRGRQRPGRLRPGGGVGSSAAAGRRAGGATTSSPPARSAACRPWPSWPRRCSATGGMLVAWKGRRDPDEEAEAGARRRAARDGARRGPRGAGGRRLRAPPPARLRKIGPDPARAAPPNRDGQEAPLRQRAAPGNRRAMPVGRLRRLWSRR